MANAWHLILKDYTFEEAEKAVVEFARNDTRDYASFPPPGKIVAEIEKGREQRDTVKSLIVSGMIHNKNYDFLPDECKRLCPEDVYERYAAEDPEKLIAERDRIFAELDKMQKSLELQ